MGGTNDSCPHPPATELMSRPGPIVGREDHRVRPPRVAYRRSRGRSHVLCPIWPLRFARQLPFLLIAASARSPTDFVGFRADPMI
jgi:hypothetical protein